MTLVPCMRWSEGSVKLIQQLRQQGFKIAVVTSSQNCEAVLKAAKLDTCFEVRVDGNTIRAHHLAGKPAPDTFLTAAQRLGVAPPRAVVVEDAIAGVQAGRSGNFHIPPNLVVDQWASITASATFGHSE
jgi:HAD superfamily hydrolase (TIGR01509 family)